MARSSGKRVVGTLLFFVALLLTLAFVFLLYAYSIDADVPLVGQIGDATLVAAIALGVIAVVLFVMLFTRRLEAKTAAADEAEVFFIPEEAPAPAAPATTGGDVTVYDLRKVPANKPSWGASEADGARVTFYFPRSVEAGVYINDYIPVDTTRILKLRTLMGGPYDPAFAFDGRRTQRPAATSAAKAVTSPPTRKGLVLQEVAPEAPAAPAQDLTYFDYPGDNHEVEDLEGIGPTYGERLRAVGVHTTARLAYEEAGALADKVQLPRRTVEQWKMMAELIKVKGIGPQYAEALVRAGVEGITELKRRSPAKIADQVNNYLETLDTNVLGTKITEKRVEGWQDAAKPLKRIRLKVPEQ